MTDIVTITLNPALDVWTQTSTVLATHKLRCEAVQRHPGGGGINVARVLHRLGAECTAVCALGGPNGQMVAQLLQDEGVSYMPVAIGGHTRESFTVSETSTGREYRFVVTGPEIHAQEWAACLALLQWQPPARYMVVSGSLPPGAPVNAYAQLASVAAQWGAHVVIDGYGPALHAVLSHKPFLLKPSLREFRELTGLPLRTLPEIKDAARAWIEHGNCQSIVVSLGDKGALLVGAETVAYAPALQIAVAGAVGAGDSFVAGMVWAHAQGQSLVESFRHGVAAASASLLNTGTQLCTAKALFDFLPKVQCFSDLSDELV